MAQADTRCIYPAGMRQLFSDLQRRIRDDPGAPFVTWYGPGGRAELSAATFGNAVAKTAGLLVDELEAAPGDSIRLDLGLHWQLSVWLAACDVAGLDVVAGAGHEGDTDLVATTDRGCAASGELILVSRSPLGLPQGPAPPGFVDHASAALGQPDVFPGPASAGRLWDGQGWLAGEQLEAECAALARDAGLAAGGRLAVTRAGGRSALACYAVALLRPASLVLLAAPAADAAAEGVTAWWPPRNPN